ncbi:MAG: F0F1 ATP synthase subunit delta [Leptolyngbya sp.]|nr:MAG: F0F1 ATP synthase subunit delta [Leptolyngbya sp.]
MKDTGVVRGEILERYAQALMSLAQQSNIVDQVGNDISTIAETLKNSEELKEFFANPLYKSEQKKAVLSQVFGDGLHSYTQNFLMLLVDRRRIMFLAGICSEFQALLRKLNQVVLAEVTTVRELTDDQIQALKDKVIALTGAHQVDLDIKLDPELIGGVVIKIGSQVIDASIRGQLRRISLRLGGVA